jgi:hypothetical protein
LAQRAVAEEALVKTSGRILIALAASGFAALASSSLIQAQTTGEPLRLSAFAVSMGTVATGRNATLDISITRWSTDEERKQLITTFLEKGPDKLLSVLQKQKDCGFIRVPGFTGPDPNNIRMGWRLRYTRQVPDPEGGRKVIIMTDRYISMWEARNQPRTMDYPFTLIEIHLNKDGQGEGKASVATKISFNKDKNQVELENYSSEPVRLNNVRVEKS